MEFNLTENKFYDQAASYYNNALSVEVAELQRKIYLPLLPLERLTDKILSAYHFYERYYWTKEDVYTSVVGNFYIPILFPMVENNTSVEMIHRKPDVDTYNKDFITSEYVTRSYVNLIIPRHIVMDFHNVIPAGTQFNIGFVGGSSNIDAIRILSVASVADPEPDEFDDRLYQTYGMKYDEILRLVGNNLKKIDAEEARRAKEEANYATNKR